MTFEAALSGKKAFEKHLDDEFVFLAQFIRLYKARVSCQHESLCVAWLQKLLSPTRDGTTRFVRNTYLAELLVAMQAGHLTGAFRKKPPEGALSLEGLGGPKEIGELGEPEWLDTVVNAPLPANEVDERTYIATQTHPESDASYAYLAVSTIDHDHWVDPHVVDNESTLIVTPPRNHHAPTTCDSCSSVNPIPEDIKLPCAQDQERCRRNASFTDDTNARPYDPNPLIHFYDELLALVECVQRTGCCSDDSYIAELLRRMKDQAIDLFDMSSQEAQIELLRRLKAKLLTRREQARRMGGASSPPPQRPAEDLHYQYPEDLDLSLDEGLWESAARRDLSPTNMALLTSVYPPALATRFVNALIRERCALIARMRAEHEVLVTSLRSDVQKDIEESLDRFREARALWILLLRANQELEHIRRHQLTNSSSAEKDLAIRETVREIRDAMMALDEEGKRGAHLANQLVSEHQDLFATEREAEKHAQLLLAHNEALRTSLITAQAQEAAQLQRINELQHQLSLATQLRT